MMSKLLMNELSKLLIGKYSIPIATSVPRQRVQGQTLKRTANNDVKSTIMTQYMVQTSFDIVTDTADLNILRTVTLVRGVMLFWFLRSALAPIACRHR